MIAFYEKLQDLLHAGTAFVSVSLVDARGSAPQDAGSKMLVTVSGLHYGTVGGGKLEKRALEEAQAMLADPSPAAQPTRLVSWRLDTDIGMTCGGSVTLFFEVYHVHPWHIVIFGAGHVAQSVTALLVSLNAQITVIDPRPEWLARLPESPRLQRLCTEDMPSRVADIPEEAFVLMMTMGHTTDKPILLEVLRTRSFPYVGVIGSAAKAQRLRQDITDAGLPDACHQAFICPIGLNLGSNHPSEIAISVVAQLLQERDRLREAPKFTKRQRTLPAKN